MGAIIKYGSQSSPVSFLNVVPQDKSAVINQSAPPDTLWLDIYQAGNVNVTPVAKNKTYAYVFKGEVLDVKSKDIEQKVCHGRENKVHKDHNPVR